MTKPSSHIPKFSKIRVSKRAHYDRDTVHAILDCGLVAHVGFIVDDRPMVIPMAYARDRDRIYIHGAKAARIIKGNKLAKACLTVTHIDGLVVARSAFHHSVNYRSAVLHGDLREVVDNEEKEHALILVTNHLLPGRWDEVRPMTDKEFAATGVLVMDIDYASAKIRNGPPNDDPADLDLEIWSGILPVHSAIGAPIADEYSNSLAPPMSLSLAKKKFS